MARKISEDISSLIDNELDEHGRHRVVQAMSDDAEMMTCWEQYHLISDTLRNNLPEIVLPDLPSRISQALSNEPSQNATPAVTTGHPLRNKAAISFALAASFAAVAVLGLLQIYKEAEIPVQNIAVTLPVDKENNVINTPVLANVDRSSNQVIRGFTADENILLRGNDPALDARLFNYLVNHNEYAVVAPVQGGMLPYARLVGYEPEQ